VYADVPVGHAATSVGWSPRAGFGRSTTIAGLVASRSASDSTWSSAIKTPPTAITAMTAMIPIGIAQLRRGSGSGTSLVPHWRQKVSPPASGELHVGQSGTAS
jgi:hypothetical protein